MNIADNPARVLIVDDMPINRTVLASMLASRGIMSDQVESGRECLELCEEYDYDLILLDHRMPELDGVDVLVELKNIFARRGKAVPVICHTSDEAKKNINLYKAAGFADVLIKPIEPRELYDAVMLYLPEVRADEELQKELDLKEVSEDEYASEPVVEVESREDAKREAEKLPMWLKIVPNIDLVSGVLSCGSAQDYLDALYIFYSSIDEKSDELLSFVETDEWTMYALRIHSLKSMARLVGAKKLGETAAALEEAARELNTRMLRKDTKEFIKAYREFKGHLSPLSDCEELIAEPQVKAEPVAAENRSRSFNYNRTILYITNGQGVVKKGIENNLSSAGFKVITVPDEPDKIIALRKEADIVIYNPMTDEDSHIVLTMNLLAEICQDDSKIFCLTGDEEEIEKAMKAGGARRVSRCYERPVGITQLIRDMNYFTELEDDYHRTKTVFVVDDDHGFLSVTEHWLSAEYQVSCFTSGEAALEGLKMVTPDLMLLDYEMPEMDGCALMKRIRDEHPEQNIPIIFLTGKNDKDHVFRVIEYKPDGYLLKTSGKDALLDVIRRFFAETLFRASFIRPEDES